MVIRGPGGVGRQLGAEHSQRLEAYQAVPGLKIGLLHLLQRQPARCHPR